MSTLPIRSTVLPQVQPLPGLAHIASVALAVIETYREALRLSHEVRKRYPFVDE
jgi:hypothetical protein